MSTPPLTVIRNAMSFDSRTGRLARKSTLVVQGEHLVEVAPELREAAQATVSTLAAAWPFRA